MEVEGRSRDKEKEDKMKCKNKIDGDFSIIFIILICYIDNFFIYEY